MEVLAFVASDIPEGVAIEPVFVIEATYGPDAAELRPRYRPEHLARIARLRSDGIVIEAGGMTDFSRAILLVRAADADAAREIATQDVYLGSGVWVEIQVHAFGRVCRPDEIAAGGRR